ncbi:MAG: hypothetical protein J0L51_10870 [Rhizobiales bacterium]|nr:hypothetical protein [Hyphomicrobiales bacterium]
MFRKIGDRATENAEGRRESWKGREGQQRLKKENTAPKRKHRARSSGAVLKPLEHDQALTTRMLNQARPDLNLTFGKD